MRRPIGSTTDAWHVLVGRGVPEADFQALRQGAPAHAAVERARPDFRALLAGAELSVSQSGYNTVVDLLRCGVQAVLVPFEAGHETEQRLRAERLKALGLAEVIPEEELSPETLVSAHPKGPASPRHRQRRPFPSTEHDGASGLPRISFAPRLVIA